ncbi:hypothetical protein CEXT_311241 [Caerostris extrusa]|uniref:Uncharacterized protein n=1 Tax=Caerostris extrusa TaxID=172846 RepID=A0AAV4NEX3_CAEEX|nr:hypothetical protein CEXT_311241 [Caerostris extrusa]
MYDFMGSEANSMVVKRGQFTWCDPIANGKKAKEVALKGWVAGVRHRPISRNSPILSVAMLKTQRVRSLCRLFSVVLFTQLQCDKDCPVIIIEAIVVPAF